jgi:type II secretory pathway pseudopilin PulG
MRKVRDNTRNRRAGLTLIELIVAFTILLILSTMALPLTSIKVQREKERRLREALSEIRTAIDRYKDAADAGMLGQEDPDNHGYPESLEVLVEGVEVQSSGMPGMVGQQGGLGQPIGGQQGGLGGGMGSSFGNQRQGAGQQGGFGSSQQGAGQQGAFGSSRQGAGGGFGSSRSGTGGSFGETGSSFGEEDAEPKKLRFLRRIPVDPMTGTAEWGMRGNSDDPDSMSWSGRNVFDVYSMSLDMALDGTRYSEW